MSITPDRMPPKHRYLNVPLFEPLQGVPNPAWLMGQSNYDVATARRRVSARQRFDTVVGLGLVMAGALALRHGELPFNVAGALALTGAAKKVADVFVAGQFSVSLSDHRPDNQ